MQGSPEEARPAWVQRRWEALVAEVGPEAAAFKVEVTRLMLVERGEELLAAGLAPEAVAATIAAEWLPPKGIDPGSAEAAEYVRYIREGVDALAPAP